MTRSAPGSPGSPVQAEAVSNGPVAVNASTWPVPSAALPDRTDPSACIDVNTTRRPSGDQTGLTFQPSKVRRFVAPRARSWT